MYGAHGTALERYADNRDGRWLDGVAGERVRIRVSGSDTTNAYGMIEAIAAPDSAAPLHLHREDETFFVLEGTMTYQIADRIVEVSAGSSVVAPAGVQHCWHNRSAAPVRTLAIFTPGGVEQLFQELGGKSLHEISALAARYGSLVIGPPTI